MMKHKYIKYLVSNKVIIILFLSSLVLHIGFGVYYINKYGTSKFSDDLTYEYYANQIIQQGIFVENVNIGQNTYEDWTVVGPGCPLIISAFILILDSYYIPYLIFNSLLISLTLIILFQIGKTVFNNKVGLTIAIWSLFYYNYFKYIPNLNKESLVYFLLPLTVLLLIYYLKRNKNKYLILAILSFSFLIHTDERYFVYFLFFAIIIFLFYRKNISIAFLKTSFWLIGVLMMMLPWLIRNYQVYDDVVILTKRTTILTSKLWGDNLMYDSSITSVVDNELIENIKAGIQYEELNIDDVLYKRINEGLKFDCYPREYSSREKYFKAFINFWQPTYFKPTYIQTGFRFMKWSLKHNLLGLVFYGVFIPFFFIGLILAIKKKLFFILFIALIPFVHMVIHVILVWPLERYRSPIDSFVVLVGLWFLFRLYEKYISKTKLFI